MNDDCDCQGDPDRYPAGGRASPFLAVLVLAALTPGTLLLTSAACLVVAFLFALFENALHGYSRAQLSAAPKPRELEEALDRVLAREEDLLFASKVGRGFFQTAGAALAVTAVVSWHLSDATTALVLAGGALLFLLINVATPYAIGERAGTRIVIRWLIPYQRSIAFLLPVTGLLHRLVTALAGGGPPPDPTEEITDELLSVVEEGTREGTLDSSEKEMIEGVIDLREVTADEIMTPRTEMICVHVDAAAADAIVRSRERGLSRLPVYRSTPDEIIGVLYMKDLLPHLANGGVPPIRELMRQPFFIPKSKNVRELLQEMRQSQIHLAIVLDEYGGTAGLVSIEDILEEIVGEIADEHELDVAREVVRLSDNVATVDGKTAIEDLNDALDLRVPESEEYDTVGGLLFARMGRVPAKGESYDLQDVRFTVLDADERRINRVKVTVARESA